MTSEECRIFEIKLAYYTAPSLLGIKCANLLSLGVNEFNIQQQIEKFNYKVESKNIKVRILCKFKDRILIFVYNEYLLVKQLSDIQNKKLLIDYGYSLEFSIENYINKLIERIYESNSFPHEIGIFLGYPIEDVTGFIINNGENYKICGSWKVYGDVTKAKRTFENYNKCRKFLCNKLNQGIDIYHALRIM